MNLDAAKQPNIDSKIWVESTEKRSFTHNSEFLIQCPQLKRHKKHGLLNFTKQALETLKLWNTHAWNFNPKNLEFPTIKLQVFYV